MGRGDVKIVIGAAADRVDGKPKPGPTVGFAWSPQLETQGEGGVRARNLARAILDKVCDNRDTLVEGWPDEKDYVQLWRVTLDVSVFGGPPRIAVDYERLPDCDDQSADDMMELYLAVKRAVGPGGGVRRARR